MARMPARDIVERRASQRGRLSEQRQRRGSEPPSLCIVYTEIRTYGTVRGRGLPMTTAMNEQQTDSGNTRKRLTLDLDPELHLRIKIAAAQAHVSMREYLEEILRESVPSLPQAPHDVRRPSSNIAPDILERLARTRQAATGSR